MGLGTAAESLLKERWGEVVGAVRECLFSCGPFPRSGVTVLWNIAL